MSRAGQILNGGKTIDWIAVVLSGEVITDIGQLSKDQLKEIRKLVKKGKLVKLRNLNYPKPKTAYGLEDIGAWKGSFPNIVMA